MITAVHRRAAVKLGCPPARTVQPPSVDEQYLFDVVGDAGGIR